MEIQLTVQRYMSSTPQAEEDQSKMIMSEKPGLFVMISKRKWRKLLHLLKSNKQAPELLRERDESNLTSLALALGYQAPLQIIERMIELDPEMAYKKDMFGATALHLACLNGSSMSSINLLILRHPDIAYEVDLDQRVALHHAVEYACSRDVSHHDDYTHDTYVDVIKMICDAAPDTLYWFDKSGETPIDMVQTMKSKCEVSSPMYEKLQLLYRELTDKSIALYMENKRRWELEGYMTKLCLNQASTDISAALISLGTDTSTIQTPNSEGRSLNLDAESYQDICVENHDNRERKSETLDTIVE